MTLLEPATPFHAEALAHLHALAFPEGERWSPDAFALQLGQPGAFGFLAPEGGMVLARVAVDEAEILTLAVDPGVRGHGLGAALLHRAMAEAARRGAASMVLEVAETNAAARRLYFVAGFAEVGRRPTYYRSGAAALILRAPIACGSTTA